MHDRADTAAQETSQAPHGLDTRSPITRIPPESLREILLYFIKSQVKPPQTHEATAYVPSIIASQVCCSWRSLALREKVFWTHISLPEAAPWVKLFLKRSGQLPISVYFGCSEDAWEERRYQIAGYRALQDIPRLRAVYLVDIMDRDYVWEYRHALVRALTMSHAPQLEEFSMTEISMPKPETGQRLFLDSPPPRLRRIVFTDVRVDPASSVFRATSLTSLSIGFCNIRTENFVEFLVTVLAGLPALEEFYSEEALCNGSFCSTTNATASPLPVAKLHHLRKFHLSHDWPDVLQVAQHLDLRFNTNTTISLHLENQEKTVMGQQYANGDDLVPSLAAAVARIAQGAGICFNRFSLSSDSCRVSADASSPSPKDLQSHIKFKLSVDIVEKILSHDREERDFDAWVRMPCLHDVKVLTIAKSRLMGRNLIRNMSVASAPGIPVMFSGVQELHFERLTLYHDPSAFVLPPPAAPALPTGKKIFNSSIMRMVQLRTELGYQTRLVFNQCSATKQTIDAMRAVLGDEVVQWEGGYEAEDSTGDGEDDSDNVYGVVSGGDLDEDSGEDDEDSGEDDEDSGEEGSDDSDSGEESCEGSDEVMVKNEMK
ncbi:hypothetical protein FA95DRAFT_1571599 [Auriscalpium vulgare]|uniref:Uncharacterized protein n=1 Tax=Auriscalpium vulgare TaxID=40419 RepID=A0ACB8RYJ3_9AGAM|nr:hypothetical protein FA95DRAFT_1571599 [Auriscalpium vulgare]